MERLKEGMLQLTKGWDRAQVERLVEDVILDVIDPYVYAEALDLMELHRSEGRRIYIVSSSPEEVVRPLARHFGVSGVIATRAAVGADGRYTGSSSSTPTAKARPRRSEPWRSGRGST